MYQGDGIDEGIDEGINDENVKTRQDKTRQDKTSTLVSLFLSYLSCVSLYLYTTTQPRTPKSLLLHLLR